MTPGRLLGMMIGILAIVPATVFGSSLDQPYSVFDRYQLEMRYGALDGSLAAESRDDVSGFDGAGKKKSPLKAFLLSAVVPGLGQYYNGQKVKSALFLGTDAAAWSLHIMWHGDGEDLTDKFEAFNREHWSEQRYSDYLLEAYGAGDDDSISAQEISHNLPDTRTQQYYEMTGKYNQFAWGWDDALLNGQGLYDFAPGSIPRIVSESTLPSSARRLAYEEMRNDANNRFDRARRMLMVLVANRLVSSVEALFSAQKINRANVHAEQQKGGSVLADMKVSASLKSLNSRRDTPWVKFTYKF